MGFNRNRHLIAELGSGGQQEFSDWKPQKNQASVMATYNVWFLEHKLRASSYELQVGCAKQLHDMLDTENN